MFLSFADNVSVVNAELKADSAAAAKEVVEISADALSLGYVPRRRLPSRAPTAQHLLAFLQANWNATLGTVLDEMR